MFSDVNILTRSVYYDAWRATDYDEEGPCGHRLPFIAVWRETEKDAAGIKQLSPIDSVEAELARIVGEK